MQRKKGYKNIAGILGICLCCSFNTGCNISTSEKNKTDIVELTFYNADGSGVIGDDPVAAVLTEKTGVKLTMTYPNNSNAQPISLMIATQEYPDMIFAKGDTGKLIEQGALIDMTELIEAYGPNIKAMYGDSLELLREEDGAIYQLSSSGFGGEIMTSSGSAQLQYAVLKENEYEIPYTLDDYEKQIKDFLKKYPVNEEGEPYIGISILASDWHWYITLSNAAGYIANGTPDNGQWIIYEEEEYRTVYKHVAKGQKEYFRWLNRMYHEGILDPEFATQTQEDYQKKLSSGRVLGIMDADWNYRDAQKELLAKGMEEHTYAGLPVTMDETVLCASLRKTDQVQSWGVGITTSCKDPVAAIRYIDYICSEEGQVLVNWGIEGIHYTIDENKKRVIPKEAQIQMQTDASYSAKTGVGKYNYPFPCYGDGVLDSTGNTYTRTNKAFVIENYSAEERAAAKAWNVELLTEIFPQNECFEPIRYGALWTYHMPEALTALTETLDAISWQELVHCIICEEDAFDEEWDAFQEKLKRAGVDQAGEWMTELVRADVARRTDQK